LDVSEEGSIYVLSVPELSSGGCWGRGTSSTATVVAKRKRVLNTYSPHPHAVMTNHLCLVAVERGGLTHWVISPQEAHKGIFLNDILFWTDS